MTLASYAAAQLIRALPRKRLSHAVGRLCEAQVPQAIARAATSAYVRLYGVDVGDAEEPESGYRTFDDFFTRRLRPGARPLSGDPLISPADGNVVASGLVRPGLELPVKGQRYQLAQLLGDPAQASGFEGGRFAVIYLSPRDYHRVHSPVSGELASVRALPGERYPVNRVGEQHFNNLLAENERVVLTLRAGELGQVGLVLVGAIVVGRISVTALGGAPPTGLRELQPPHQLQAGDEVGVFHLGSTVVLLVQQGVRLEPLLGPIRYGQSLQSP